jgi:hypothetical protein
MRKRLYVSIICLSVFVALVVSRRASQPPDYRAILLSPAPAYRNAPFIDDPQFWEELKIWPFGCEYGQQATPYRSKYFNVDNLCQRRVVGQTNAARRIWLLGSSTVFNSESPDEWTIASQMQSRLPDWRVETRTMNSATLLTMVRLLKESPAKRGDVAVLYGIWSDEVVLARGDTGRIKAVELAVQMAREWCADHGIRLIIVAQPTVWSRTITAEEQAILETADTTAGPLDAQRIVEAHKTLMGLIPDALDLTHVLDKLRDDGPVYFDGWHTNWRANEIIAETIVSALKSP